MLLGTMTVSNVSGTATDMLNHGSNEIFPVNPIFTFLQNNIL